MNSRLADALEGGLLGGEEGVPVAAQGGEHAGGRDVGDVQGEQVKVGDDADLRRRMGGKVGWVESERGASVGFCAPMPPDASRSLPSLPRNSLSPMPTHHAAIAIHDGQARDALADQQLQGWKRERERV